MAMNAPDTPGMPRRRRSRRVTILGSTGSIGQSTVDLLLRNRDGFAVEALTANRNAALSGRAGAGTAGALCRGRRSRPTIRR